MLALTILKENKSRFTTHQYQALITIASCPNEYRRNLEASNDTIHYIPAIIQKVENKLKAIGLEVVSYPACDGSRRKRYDLRINSEHLSLCDIKKSHEEAS